MSIIIISGDAYCTCKGVIEGVSETMGYKMLGDEVIVEAAQEFGVPFKQLSKAIHEPPSFLGISLSTKKKYIVYIQAVTMRHFLADDIVYHGPAGHLLIQGVSHVLKVRVTANIEDRIKRKMEDEKVSETSARKSIAALDRDSKKWAKAVYGFDDTHESLYDLVISLGQIDPATAVDIITNTVQTKRFQPMTYSINCMKYVELAARIKSKLVDIDPDVEVRVDNEKMHIHSSAPERDRKKRTDDIQAALVEIPDAKEPEIKVTKSIYEQITDGHK
jgi:cytidylate kinase